MRTLLMVGIVAASLIGCAGIFEGDTQGTDGSISNADAYQENDIPEIDGGLESDPDDGPDLPLYPCGKNPLDIRKDDLTLWLDANDTTKIKWSERTGEFLSWTGKSNIPFVFRPVPNESRPTYSDEASPGGRKMLKMDGSPLISDNRFATEEDLWAGRHGGLEIWIVKRQRRADYNVPSFTWASYDDPNPMYRVMIHLPHIDSDVIFDLGLWRHPSNSEGRVRYNETTPNGVFRIWRFSYLAGNARIDMDGERRIAQAVQYDADKVGQHPLWIDGFTGDLLEVVVNRTPSVGTDLEELMAYFRCKWKAPLEDPADIPD